jgi:predicted RecA/RadA family phage recombinase
MAKNYVQPGDTITMTAPYAVASGAGLLVGAVFAVALADAANGATVEAKRNGVWDLAKATGQAWVADTTKLYWDNTNKVVTSTASGNVLIGVARQTQASGDTVGRVLLTGQLS